MNPFRMFSRPLISADSACDPYFSNVVSLLHFDGVDGGTTFTDVTGKIWTASGAAELDTSSPKFGTAAGLFNGTNSLISTPHDTDFVFGADNFTIEMWLKPAALSGYGVLCSKWDGATGGRSFILYHNAGKLEFYYSTTGYDSYLTISTDTVLSTSGDYIHLAIVRDGGWLRSYVNGVNCQMAGSPSSGDIFIGSVAFAAGAPGRPFCYGGQTPDAFGWFNGLIDDARVTKGVCRYPNGTTFTPPTIPFYDVACGGANPLATSILAKLTEWWELGSATSPATASINAPTYNLPITTPVTATGVKGGGDLAQDVAALANGAGGVGGTITQLLQDTPSWEWFGWVYIDSFKSGVTPVIQRWDDVGSTTQEYQIGTYSGGPGLYLQQGGTSYVTAVRGGLSTGQWYFFNAWRDGADGYLRIQVNCDGTVGVSASPGIGVTDTSNRPLYFGRNTGTTPAFMDARIQRFGLVKGNILTSAERLYLYNSGLSKSYSEIVADAG